MRSILLYTTLLLIILVSCKKKSNEIIITGIVADNVSAEYLSNVNIVLSGKVIESGKWTNSYSQLATSSTDNNGKYTIKLDAVRVSEYKLSFSKDNYIDEIKIMQPDDISTDNENTINVNLYLKSFLNLSVKNKYPVNSNDYMSFKLSGNFKSCTSCCSNEKFEFSGTDINQNILCICPSNQNIIINWDVLKGGSVNSYSDTIFIGQGDTTNYLLNY